MKIDIEKLKISIEKLNNLLNDYENIYKSFYHEMVNLKSYWHDAHANAFFEKIREEKKANTVFFREFKSICDLYNYIYNQYLDMGDKINFDLSNREIFISKIDKYINNIDNVINKYDNLDTDFDLEISKYLSEEKSKYSNIKEKLLSIKESNKEIIDNISNIEKQIKLKISKIHVKAIESNSIADSSLGSLDDVYVDVDNMNLIVNKLEFYVKNESINFESVNEILSEIGYIYNTDNRDKLNDLLIKFIRKYKVIIKNHRNNVILINNNKDRYNNITYKFNSFFGDEV